MDALDRPNPPRLRAPTGPLAVLRSHLEARVEAYRHETDCTYAIELEGLSKDAQADALDDALRVTAERIVGEALTNAHAHAQADAVRVRIALTPSHLRIAVEDDGCGICPGRIGHPTPGGLARMRSQAQAAGGSVWIETPVLGGTIVRLRLPRREAQRRSRR